MRALCLALFVLMTSSLTVLARQTVIIPASYSRQLRGVEHTWAFRGNVMGVKYKDGTPVGAEEVRQFAANAVEQWCEAANQEGLRLRVSEAGEYDQAEIKILFAPYNGVLGSTVSNYIQIADSGHAWPQRLQTTILHEMGHMLLGGGHYGDGVMSQLVGSGHPSIVQTTLSPTERRWVLEIYNPRVKFTVANVFGNGTFGGRVLIDSTERVIPVGTGVLEFDTARASTFPHMLTALNHQTAGGYLQEFDCWGGAGDGQCVSLSIDTVNNARYEARFRNVYNLILGNDFAGSKGSGFIKVDNAVISLPMYSIGILQGRPVLLEAPDQPIDFILYRFFSWSDGSVTNPRILNPEGHSTLTARYVAWASLPPPEVRVTGGAGEKVCVAWKEHPSRDVSEYKITRRTKGRDGKPSVTVSLARLDRGRTSWSDGQYLITGKLTQEVVTYGVQSYFAPNARYSEPEFVEVFAERTREDLTDASNPSLNAIPTRFGFSHYPHPSRGTTWIELQLPHTAQSTVEVFDILGRRICTLLNLRLSAGRHIVSWPGTTESGLPAPAGLYVWRFHAQATIDGCPESFTAASRMVVVR